MVEGAGLEVESSSNHNAARKLVQKMVCAYQLLD